MSRIYWMSVVYRVQQKPVEYCKGDGWQVTDLQEDDCDTS